jgi:hypothetical protein
VTQCSLAWSILAEVRALHRAGRACLGEPDPVWPASESFQAVGVPWPYVAGCPVNTTGHWNLTLPRADIALAQGPGPPPGPSDSCSESLLARPRLEVDSTLSLAIDSSLSSTCSLLHCNGPVLEVAEASQQPVLELEGGPSCAGDQAELESHGTKSGSWPTESQAGCSPPTGVTVAQAQAESSAWTLWSQTSQWGSLVPGTASTGSGVVVSLSVPRTTQRQQCQKPPRQHEVAPAWIAQNRPPPSPGSRRRTPAVATTRILLAVACVCLYYSESVTQAVTTAEMAALKDLYNATGGDKWSIDGSWTGWSDFTLSFNPCPSPSFGDTEPGWTGVGCNDKGNVIMYVEG